MGSTELQGKNGKLSRQSWTEPEGNGPGSTENLDFRTQAAGSFSSGGEVTNSFKTPMKSMTLFPENGPSSHDIRIFFRGLKNPLSGSSGRALEAAVSLKRGPGRSKESSRRAQSRVGAERPIIRSTRGALTRGHNQVRLRAYAREPRVREQIGDPTCVRSAETGS